MGLWLPPLYNKGVRPENCTASFSSKLSQVSPTICIISTRCCPVICNMLAFQLFVIIHRKLWKVFVSALHISLSNESQSPSFQIWRSWWFSPFREGCLAIFKLSLERHKALSKICSLTSNKLEIKSQERSVKMQK